MIKDGARGGAGVEITPEDGDDSVHAVADADAQAEGRPETKVCRSAGAVGYFAQTPFILNETLRENILLGAPMDEP